MMKKPKPVGCRPPEGTKYGTSHLLECRIGQGHTAGVYEWVEGGWSTPGTGFHTSVTHMSALGWRYVKPL